MGHLAALKREYRDLVERLGEGSIGLPEPEAESARTGWQEVLEILYTPEDAALAARLPVLPTPLPELAARLKTPAPELKARLDAMAERGLVLDLVHPETGQAQYLLAPPVVGFFEFSMMRAKDSIPKKRMAQAMDAYFHGDETFAREVFGQETQIGRALSHRAPDEEAPEVLDWERAEAIVKGARSAAVSLCYCRHKAEHLGAACDTPLETCLSLNGGADFVVRRGFGRPVEKAEALAILAAARAKGLVHIADNVQSRPSWICNCCACCCMQLKAVNTMGLPAVTPSGFEPENDPSSCTGCSRCARACPAAAVSMAPVRKEGAPRGGLVPRFDRDRCLGCAVCAGACPKESISMRRREKPARVPANSVEKALRMALERGRLPHLLFDAGAGAGPRALNRLLQGLCALPPVERLLASEAVRSAFVRAALARIPDPG